MASARAIAGTGFGGITTWESSGQSRDFVSDCSSPGERDRFLELTNAIELWDNLREATQPLRLKDLSAHVASLDLPGHASMKRSFMGMPIRHQDTPAGYFFLFDKKAGQEFTGEDEGIMALFAAQAGAAIANARKYQDGMQANS